MNGRERAIHNLNQLVVAPVTCTQLHSIVLITYDSYDVLTDHLYIVYIYIDIHTLYLMCVYICIYIYGSNITELNRTFIIHHMTLLQISIATSDSQAWAWHGAMLRRFCSTLPHAGYAPPGAECGDQKGGAGWNFEVRCLDMFSMCRYQEK
jgi:hypothetical protein